MKMIYAFGFCALFCGAVYSLLHDGREALRISELERQVNNMFTEVNELRVTLHREKECLERWEKIDFYKEKFAREKMQMAKFFDLIYLC
ncbi:hypothetical protein HOD08_01360 [bacterium]|nr:hypothetical protein [bacterium]